MKIGVVGYSKDPLTLHTIQVGRGLGHDVELIDLVGMSNGVPVVYDGLGWMVGPHELDLFDGFIVRAYPGSAALHGSDPGARVTVSEAWQATMQQRDRHDFGVGCLMALEASGKTMINPPLRSFSYDKKPLQLAALVAANISVPRTLITNLAPAVRLFCEDVGQAIMKPVGGGVETQLVTAEILAGLSQRLHDTPVIFQERIVGPDIRVTVVGGEIVSSVSIASHAVDYRLGEAYRAGNQHYATHTLPAKVAAACIKVAELNHLVLAGIDLKLNEQGEYFFLEANSAPVYLDIELKTGAPITECLFRWLARQSA